MAQWFSVAENLLNQVDAAVMKTVNNIAPQTQETDATTSCTPQHSTAKAPNTERPESSQDANSEASGTGFVYASKGSPFVSPTSAKPTAFPDDDTATPRYQGTTHIDNSGNHSHSITGTIPKQGLSISPMTAALQRSANKPSTPAHEPRPAATPNQQRDSNGNSTPQAGLQGQQTNQVLPQSIKADQLPASMNVTLAKVSQGPLEPVQASQDSSVPAAMQSPDSNTQTGTAREQQLSKLVDQLKERLRVRHIESEQLEDLLAQAEARCEREKALTSQLANELAGVKDSKVSMEAAFTAQLNQQAAALHEASALADGLARQVCQLEGQLAAATESSRSWMENKASLEDDMLEALRGQLSRVEAALDTERRAHSATRNAVIAREGELEAALAGNAAALAQMQHRVEESANRIRDLEDSLAVAQATVKELEIQVVGGPATGGRSKELTALQEEVVQLRLELEELSHSLRQAESARHAAEAEATTLRSELTAVRAEAEQAAWRQDVVQLQASLREAHDLLMQKTAAIEQLNADRAALQIRLDRELAAASRHQSQPHQALTMIQSDYGHTSQLNYRGAGGLTSIEPAVVPMGSALGERWRRLASRKDSVGTAVAGAANFVDRTASGVARLLRQYPLVRLGMLVYLLGLHMFVYVLVLRMHHAAVRMLDKEQNTP